MTEEILYSGMIHSLRETAAILLIFNLLMFRDLCSLEIHLVCGLFILVSEQQFKSGELFFLTFLEGNNKERRTLREPNSELPCTSCQTKVKFALGVSLQ